MSEESVSEEKILKTEGEDLAKVAVESKMAAKQLQTLYRLVRTRPLAFVEAYVQRQIGREVRGYESFLKTWELLKKYEDRRSQLEKVLMYAVMLYDYYEKEPVLKLKSVAYPVVRRVAERQGAILDSLDINLERQTLTVWVRGFRGSPKMLATDIEKSLKSEKEFSALNLKVWIEPK